jgi:hypothetical protein
VTPHKRRSRQLILDECHNSESLVEKGRVFGEIPKVSWSLIARDMAAAHI